MELMESYEPSPAQPPLLHPKAHSHPLPWPRACLPESKAVWLGCAQTSTWGQLPGGMGSWRMLELDSVAMGAALGPREQVWKAVEVQEWPLVSLGLVSRKCPLCVWPG